MANSPGGAGHFFGGGPGIASPGGLGLRLRPVAAGQQRPCGAAGGEDRRTPARWGGGNPAIPAGPGGFGGPLGGAGDGVKWLECGNIVGRYRKMAWQHGRALAMFPFQK